MGSYVMVLKGRELAHYLTGKKHSLSFMKPEYQVDRGDTDDIRRKILATLSQQLMHEYGKGFSYSALIRLVQSSEVLTDNKI